MNDSPTMREIERLTRRYHAPGTGLAIRAKVAADLAQAWARAAEEDARESAHVLNTSAAAFGDGMTYVPGRGRVRNPGSTP